jgi:hypothetical protein
MAIWALQDACDTLLDGHYDEMGKECRCPFCRNAEWLSLSLEFADAAFAGELWTHCFPEHDARMALECRRNGNEQEAQEWEKRRLVKSPRARPTAHSTIIRWIRSGKIEGRKRGCYWFVNREQLLAVLQPVAVEKAGPGHAIKPPSDRWRSSCAKQVLDAAGI